jgi:hypothetical protein
VTVFNFSAPQAAIRSASKDRRTLIGKWGGRSSTWYGDFKFTLTFYENGSLSGKGKYTSGSDSTEIFVTGRWNVTQGHIYTKYTQITARQTISPLAWELINKAYGPDKKIIILTESELEFEVPDSFTMIFLHRIESNESLKKLIEEAERLLQRNEAALKGLEQK